MVPYIFKFNCQSPSTIRATVSGRINGTNRAFVTCLLIHHHAQDSDDIDAVLVFDVAPSHLDHSLSCRLYLLDGVAVSLLRLYFFPAVIGEESCLSGVSRTRLNRGLLTAKTNAGD